MNSGDLFWALNSLDLISRDKKPHWWPNAGEFEVLISVILTQQSKWEKVEKSLQNLRELGLLDLDKIVDCDFWVLAQAIVPSGLYNQKAKRIKELCANIKTTFLDLENFKETTTRDWLLTQKGVGPESADSILNYFCFKEEMVVDSYTARLLGEFGYVFEGYDGIKSWLYQDFENNLDLITKKLNIKKYEIFMLYHGMIVEYGEKFGKKGKIDITVIKKAVENEF